MKTEARGKYGTNNYKLVQDITRVSNKLLQMKRDYLTDLNFVCTNDVKDIVTLDNGTYIYMLTNGVVSIANCETDKVVHTFKVNTMTEAKVHWLYARIMTILSE